MVKTSGVTETYRPCICGLDCPYYAETPGQPCWGETETYRGDDSAQFHACQGHIAMSDGGAYRPEVIWGTAARG